MASIYGAKSGFDQHRTVAHGPQATTRSKFVTAREDDYYLCPYHHYMYAHTALLLLPHSCQGVSPSWAPRPEHRFV